MANPVQILEALQRVDPASAQVLATSVLLDLTNEAFDDVVKSYGTQMVSLVDDMTNRWRAEAGGTYVHEIAKSADPAAAAAAVSRFTEAIADAVAVREALLFEIEKAEQDEQWNDPLGGGVITRRVRRDAKGRFTRGIASQSSDITSWRRPEDKKASRRARALPSNVAQAVKPARDDGSGVAWDPMVLADDDQKMKYERYLGQIAQVDDLRRELATAFRGSKRAGEMLSVDLRLRDAATGQMETQNVPLTGGLDDFAWDPNREAVEVNYGPNPDLDYDEQQKVNAQLALGALPGLNAGGLDPRLLANLGSMIMRGTTTAENYDEAKTKRLRRFTESTANVLQSVPLGSAQNAASYMRGAAEVLGGAEQLKEPMSRAAYRMRGTTRDPDRNLVEGVQGERLSPVEQAFVDQTMGVSRKPASEKDRQRAVDEAFGPQLERLKADPRSWAVDYRDQSAPNGRRVPAGAYRAKLDEYHRASAKAAKEPQAVGPVDASKLSNREGNQAVTNALVSRLAAGESGEQAMRGAQRDAAAMHFVDQMIESTASRNKDSGRVNFNRLSDQVAYGIGRGFPSEGAIIDAKGKVAAQSVGIAEDHYLPFDLANYKSLNGGSYVRTRTLGGLTSEDMRALLLGNARAATVVSASGVFDIELDPKLRGGRRYNDKVARIPEMYDRILDEIANGGHYAVDLSPVERDEVDSQVAQWLSFTPNASEKQIEAKRTEFTEKKRRELEQLTADDRKKARAEAEKYVKSENIPASQREGAVAEEEQRQLNTIKRDKVRALRVNGEGYDLALKTLQRYFPYYVRSVSHRSLEQLSGDVVGNRTVAASARALDVESNDKWRVRPGHNVRNPEGLKLRTGPDGKPNPNRRWQMGGVKQESDSTGGASGGPSPSPKKEKDEGESEPAEVAAAPQPDIGSSEKVTEEGKKYLNTAVRKWNSELRSYWASQGNPIDAILEQQFGTDASGEPVDALDVLTDPDLAAGDAALAFFGSLYLQGGRDGMKAIMALGSSQELRDKLLSEESKIAFLNAMEPDTGGDADLVDKLSDQLATMTRMSQLLASDWVRPSGGNVVSDFLQGKGKPVAFPELAVADKKELERFADDPLGGIPAELRDEAAYNLQSDGTELTQMGHRALVAAKAVEAVAQLGSSGKSPTTNDAALGVLNDVFLADDEAEHAENDAQQLSRATDLAVRLAGYEGNETDLYAVTHPEVMNRVALSAIAEYSLMMRRMQLEFGDSPKAKAAFPAAKQPVGKSLNLETLRVAKSLEWERRYGSRHLLSR